MNQGKILHLAYSSDLAGGERVILNIIEQLPQYFQAVVLPSSQGTFVEELKKKNIPFYVISFKKTYNWDYSQKLTELAEKENYQLVVSHGLLVNLLGRIAKFIAQNKGIEFKLINVIHLTHQYGRKFNFRFIYYFLYDLFTLPLTDQIVAVSKGVKKYFTHFFPFYKRISIIRNSAPEKEINLFLKKIRGKTNKLKKKYLKLYHLENYSKIILTISRLAQQKNLPLLFSLAKQYPRYLFLVVGDGALKEELTRKKREENLKNILFIGWRKQAFRYLVLADFFLLPSLWEGFPITILESFYLKTPVLASRIPGNTEAVIHQKTGFLANPHQPLEFIKGLEWLEKHKEQIVEDAFSFYQKNFSLTIQAQNYQKLFQRFLMEY